MTQKSHVGNGSIRYKSSVVKVHSHAAPDGLCALLTGPAAPKLAHEYPQEHQAPECQQASVALGAEVRRAMPTRRDPLGRWRKAGIRWALRADGRGRHVHQAEPQKMAGLLPPPL